MKTRVQIPAYTDRWMMGDRFGELVKTTRYRGIDVAHVKLDISQKTIKVKLDDVTIVD